MIILQQNIYEIQKRWNFIQVNYFCEKKIIRGKTNDGKYITVIHFKLKRSEVGGRNVQLFSIKYKISNWLPLRSSNISSFFFFCFTRALSLHPHHFRFIIIVPNLPILSTMKSAVKTITDIDWLIHKLIEWRKTTQRTPRYILWIWKRWV